MKSTKFAAVIISIVFIITATSCLSKVNQKVGDSVKIYLLDEDKNIRNAVQEYNQKNGDQITEQVFYRDQSEEMAETLQYELAVGEGPDIIIFKPDMLPELSKYMEKGVFYNIDESIKKDKSFKIEDYNSTVMEYGMYNGKRYTIPLYYSMNAFFTTDKILEKSGITSDTISMDMDDTAESASKYINQSGTKYFFSPLDFSYFIDIDRDLIDIDGKKANFNTLDFIKLLDSYKKLNDTSLKDKSFEEYLKGSDSELLKNGDTIMNLQNINCFRFLWARYNTFDEDVIPKVRVLTPPGKEAHVSAVPVELVAINVNCKNVKAAYDFIKLLLSEKYQENTNVYGLPINNKAFETQKEIFEKGVGGKDYTSPLRSGGIKSDISAHILISDIEEISKKMDKCVLKDYSIYDLINEVVKEFLKGSLTSEGAAQKIQYKVQEYLNTPLATPRKKMVSENNTKAESKLKIYYMNYEFNVVNALRVFEKEFPDVELEKEMFDDNDVHKTRLTTELMSGEGPDVITFKNSVFPAFHKIVDGGAFCNLDDMITTDKDFNLDDYNEKVLEAGVYNGKRYYIPISYNYSFLITTEKQLESSNIQYDKENWTWDNFASLSKGFKNSGINDSKYLFGYSRSFDFLLNNCGIQFIDYKEKKTSFNSDKFIELMKIYRELYPAITPDNVGFNEKELRQYFKSCIFVSFGGLNDWMETWCANNDIKKYTGEEAKVYPMPSLIGGMAKAYIAPARYVAINSNSTNKQDAFNFVKVLLSEDIQKSKDNFGNDNLLFSMPVNRKAYVADMKFYTSKYGETKSSRFGEEVDALLRNAELRLVYDQNVDQIISDEVDAYVQGKKTAEKAAAEIDRKITLILNE